MASYNPRQLKDEILQRLGAPIINIEVTEQQIFSAIERSLELFGEYHFNGTNKSYIAIRVGDETDISGMNGVFDLSERGLFAVTKILSTSDDMIPTWGGGAPYQWFSDMMTSLSGAQGTSSIGYYGYNSTGYNLGYYTQFMQYFSMMQETFSPKSDFWFNDNTGQLKIMSSFNPNDIIIIEAYVQSFADVNHSIGSTAGYGYAGESHSNWNVSETYDNPYHQQGGGSFAGMDMELSQGSYNNRWVKDYATALVKEMNGQILAKHQGLQLSGGITVDGLRLIEEARLEKETLRQELLLLDTPVPIIIG